MSDARAKLMSCVIKLNPYYFLVAVAVVVAGTILHVHHAFFILFFAVTARLRRENT